MLSVPICRGHDDNNFLFKFKFKFKLRTLPDSVVTTHSAADIMVCLLWVRKTPARDVQLQYMEAKACMKQSR